MKVGKTAAAFLSGLLLLYIGHRGRQHATLQARLHEFTLVCEQLQQKLDEAQTPTEALEADVQAKPSNALRALAPDPQRTTLVDALKTGLRQFDLDFSPTRLSEVESLEIRLSKATLAIAEQRFADALTTITDEDERGTRDGPKVQTGQVVRVLQIRALSFYGLREWQEALLRFRHLLILQPNRTAVVARIAECLEALGRQADAITTYAELAKSHSRRGDGFLVEGKLGAALADYQKAIQIQAKLLEREGQSELAGEMAMSYERLGNGYLIQGKPVNAIGQYQKAIEIQTRFMGKGDRSELAMIHNSLGNAYLVQGKPGSAEGYYQTAIEIQGRLVDNGGHNELESDLALSHWNLANALLGQQNLEAASGQYEKAIERQTRLLEKEGRRDLGDELAMSRNNRGVVRRAQGKLDAAIADFQSAIVLLTQPIQQQARNLSALKDRGRGIFPRARVKLDVAIGFSESSIDVLTRTRVLAPGSRREPAVALAMSLRNRGYAYLVQRKTEAAVDDFQKAVEIFARLVDQDGQKDLAPQFAKSLCPLAWLYATYPDSSFRNGVKAQEYALRACELSEWKAFIPIETLAAACAEKGDFAGAAAWQEKDVDLAPNQQKVDLRSRLEIFKSGNPYRAPLPKAE